MDQSIKREPIGEGKFLYVSSHHTFGTDAVLLKHFAKARKNDKAVDLGTGCGIIAFLMLRDGNCQEVYGVDISNEAIELAKHAERSGADAIAAVPPCFFYYDNDDLYNYYKKLASAVNIPLIIYYHPGAQKTMSPELITKIFEVDNVTGVKWSSGDLFSMMKLKDMTHGDMNIINGPDELLCMGLVAGADAGIGSTYNSMLPRFINIYNAVQKGDIATASRIQMETNRIIDLMLKFEVIPAVKYSMELLGFPVGNATFPMRHLNDAQKAEYRELLDKAGFSFSR